MVKPRILILLSLSHKTLRYNALLTISSQLSESYVLSAAVGYSDDSRNESISVRNIKRESSVLLIHCTTPGRLYSLGLRINVGGIVDET